MGWELTETGSTRKYSPLAAGHVWATGQSYGPLYRWELSLAGSPAGHGHANTVVEAMAAADAALERLLGCLGREPAPSKAESFDLLLTDAESYFDTVVKQRRAAGRKTYGTGLEHTDPQYQWNRMALEEALDLGQYLAARCRQLEDELGAERARVAQLRARLGE